MSSLLKQQQAPKGYKQTEVGVIPEDWGLTLLGSLVNFRGGYAFKSSHFKTEGIYQVVKMTNVYGGGLKLSRSASFLNSLTSSERSYLLEKDDILITLTGTVGKEDYGYTCRIKNEKNLLLNQRVSKITSKGKIDPILLEYETKLRRFGRQFYDRSKGGTGNQSNVSTIDLATILIPVPSRNEQTAIANALSDVDALITSLEKLIAKKRAIKTAAMLQLLTGKKRLPPFDQAHTGYKQTELGEIPEDWDVKTVFQSTENIIDYRGVTPKKLGMDWGGGDIVALSAGNVKKGYIDFNEESYLGSEKLYKRWMRNGDTQKGDVVFTMEAPLGNVAIIPDDRKYILSQRTILLQFYGHLAFGGYLFQYFLSSDFQSRLSDRATGSTAQGIKRSIFELLELPLPSVDEQELIAEVLSDIDKEIDVLQNRLNKTQQLKQGMMQELLTGRTRLV